MNDHPSLLYKRTQKPEQNQDEGRNQEFLQVAHLHTGAQALESSSAALPGTVAGSGSEARNKLAPIKDAGITDIVVYYIYVTLSEFGLVFLIPYLRDNVKGNVPLNCIYEICCCFIN